MAGNESLIAEYKDIHATSDWGGTSIKNLRYLTPHLTLLAPRTIIDYGCGKSRLLDVIDIPSLERRSRFDPAIPEYAKLDRGPHDVLINVDVLEHIDEEDLDELLSEMAAVSRDALIVVDTQPAKLHLADGRNAHITQHDHAWWQKRMEPYFGALYPIRVKRRGRAAFRTWDVSGADRIRLLRLQVREAIKYMLRRMRGLKY